MKTSQLTLIGTILAVSALSIPMLISETSPKSEMNDESKLRLDAEMELKDLESMSCDNIIQRNSKGQYLSKENRNFAREKVLDCSGIEEFFAVNASCEELYERYHSGQKYWFEDHKTITENALAKCSDTSLNDNENPELLEKILDYCNSTDVKQSPVMALSNYTHIITSDTCEWQTIEKYESDGMLNFVQSNCKDDIRPIEDPTPWSNTTHYIDTDSCEWQYIGPATNSINKWGDAPIYKQENEN